MRLLFSSVLAEAETRVHAGGGLLSKEYIGIVLLCLYRLVHRTGTKKSI